MKNGAWKSTKRSNAPENQFAAYQDSNSKERAETPSFFAATKGAKSVRVYKQLTKTDRLRIEKWLRQGLCVQEIADRLRVHRSTIYRELKRGHYEWRDGKTWEMKSGYSPDIAEQRYQDNLRAKGPDLKIGNDHEFAQYIETTIIEKKCSPAAALGYAKIEGKQFRTQISVQTLYKYIGAGVFLQLTKKQLPRRGEQKRKYQRVKKKKAARAPAGESIEKRPKEVKDRKTFGHWEMDTVYSGQGKSRQALLVLTERKTREEIIIMVTNRQAETTVKAIDRLERKMGAVKFRKIFKSITVDNGTEFALADKLERSCINKSTPRTKVYFCHPYSSWERGSNENANGLIRRWYPKGTDFAKVSKAEIVELEEWINSYPRKILGYSSSKIEYRKCLNEIGIAS